MDLDEAVRLLAGSTLINPETRLGEARTVVLGVVERAQEVRDQSGWPSYDKDVARYILGEEQP